MMQQKIDVLGLLQVSIIQREIEEFNKTFCDISFILYLCCLGESGKKGTNIEKVDYCGVGLNYYSYCGGNPMGYTDPSGLSQMPEYYNSYMAWAGSSAGNPAMRPGGGSHGNSFSLANMVTSTTYGGDPRWSGENATAENFARFSDYLSHGSSSGSAMYDNMISDLKEMLHDEYTTDFYNKKYWESQNVKVESDFDNAFNIVKAIANFIGNILYAGNGENPTISHWEDYESDDTTQLKYGVVPFIGKGGNWPVLQNGVLASTSKIKGLISQFEAQGGRVEIVNQIQCLNGNVVLGGFKFKGTQPTIFLFKGATEKTFVHEFIHYRQATLKGITDTASFNIWRDANRALIEKKVDIILGKLGY